MHADLHCPDDPPTIVKVPLNERPSPASVIEKLADWFASLLTSVPVRVLPSIVPVRVPADPLPFHTPPTLCPLWVNTQKLPSGAELTQVPLQVFVTWPAALGANVSTAVATSALRTADSE